MEFWWGLPLVLIGLMLCGCAILCQREMDGMTAGRWVRVPFQLEIARLIPGGATGETVAGPIDPDQASVLVHYRYAFAGRHYLGRKVFPLDVEWVSPRVSALVVYDALLSGKLHSCYVDSTRPDHAVLYLGWSPYLRKHTNGLWGSGFVVIVLGLLAAWIYW